ncbi:MAG: pyridoxamine kinase [Oscillibacter sp.]|nr:pyridoxamine kinase [Oscillibacter sp.]
MSVPCVAAIHDLSCFGRCSLTVVAPVLSAMGCQCAPLPTALLSTHTGGFEDNTFRDLTGEMEGIAAHWKALGLAFRAIYSGFLGSKRQIALVEAFLRDFRGKDTLAVVDPVMGDHGKPYRTYTAALCRGVRELARAADVITPNLTEAAILLDLPYERVREMDAEETVKRLGENGKRSVVLTGYSSQAGRVGAMCYDREGGRIDTVETDRVAKEYHGTGDLFAAVLTGGLAKGETLIRAAERAAGFVRICVAHTAEQDAPTRNGVEFEPLLGLLTEE